MATVTGYTAAKMDEINNATVVDGNIVGDNLILVTRGGTNIDAGNVRGPVGAQASALTVVTNQAALPTYTAGTGHDNDVAFTDDTNEFWIWADGTLSWTKIASTVPSTVGNPILLAAPSGDALFGHITPGNNAGFKVTSAGGLVLTSLTDFRVNVGGSTRMRIESNGEVISKSKIGIEDHVFGGTHAYLHNWLQTVMVADSSGLGYLPIAASAFTVNSTIRGKRDVENLGGSSLTKLASVSGKKYRRAHVSPNSKKETGLVVEDLEAAGLDDVVYGEDEHKGYNLAGLVTHLVDALNELSAKVEALEAQVAGT